MRSNSSTRLVPNSRRELNPPCASARIWVPQESTDHSLPRRNRLMPLTDSVRSEANRVSALFARFCSGRVIGGSDDCCNVAKKAALFPIVPPVRRRSIQRAIADGTHAFTDSKAPGFPPGPASLPDGWPSRGGDRLWQLDACGQPERPGRQEVRRARL